VKRIAFAMVLGSLCAPVCYSVNALPRLLHSGFDPPFWVWPVLVSPVTEEVCKAFALLVFWGLASGKSVPAHPRVWQWLGLFVGVGFGLTEAGLHRYLHDWTRDDLIIRSVVVVFIHGLPTALVGLSTALRGGRGWVLSVVAAVAWHSSWNASLVFSSGSHMFSPLWLTFYFAIIGTGVFVLPLFIGGSIFRPNRDVRKCDEQ
jgi:hypothetical protein